MKTWIKKIFIINDEYLNKNVDFSYVEILGISWFIFDDFGNEHPNSLDISPLKYKTFNEMN